MKKCNKCLEVKSLDLFFKAKKTSTGLYTICKACKTASTLAWRARNRDKYNASMRRYNSIHRKRIHFQSAYGITLDEYYKILEDQAYRCAMCRKLPSTKRQLVVDHCHGSGRIRGLLCYGCNRAIAILDNPVAYKQAVEYLKTKPSS